MLVRCCALLLSLISFVDMAAARVGEIVEGRVEVVDGDTIGLSGVPDRIRLYGIDAPEGQQTCDSASGERYLCGSISAQQLQTLVGRNGIARCEVVDVDRYGRSVAECVTDRFNLNEAMVRSGWAVHYEQYSDGRYAEAERQARSEGLGVWSGRFVAPWDWRRGERLESEVAHAVASPGGPPSSDGASREARSFRAEESHLGQRLVHRAHLSRARRHELQTHPHRRVRGGTLVLFRGRGRDGGMAPRPALMGRSASR